MPGNSISVIGHYTVHALLHVFHLTSTVVCD